MATHKLINFFTEQEVAEILNIVDSLEDKWTKRIITDSVNFFTLGQESSIDCVNYDDNTINLTHNSNKMLKENFHFMYTSIISKFSELYGKCELATDVPIPGFFIYTEHKGVQSRNNGFSKIHKDGRFEHLDYYWNTFKKVDHDNVIGITIALELPKSGSGMFIWDQPDQGFYSNSEWANSVKYSDFNLNPESANHLNSNIINKIPNVVEYSVGKAIVQDGPQFHAVAHGTNLSIKDRRVTIQIFAKKCDGIWRLYF